MVKATFFGDFFLQPKKKAAGSGSGVFPANTNSATLGSLPMMSHVQEHGFLGLPGKIISLKFKLYLAPILMIAEGEKVHTAVCQFQASTSSSAPR
jgi:hypothetical protein